jgi:hypothetical protein
LIIPDDNVERCIALKDRFYDLAGLSIYSGLGISTLREHIKKRGLPAFRIVGKLVVRQSEYDQWAEKFRLNNSQDISAAVNQVMKSLKRT